MSFDFSSLTKVVPLRYNPIVKLFCFSSELITSLNKSPNLRKLSLIGLSFAKDHEPDRFDISIRVP